MLMICCGLNVDFISHRECGEIRHSVVVVVVDDGSYILDGAGDSVQSFIISDLRQITLNIYLLEL